MTSPSLLGREGRREGGREGGRDECGDARRGTAEQGEGGREDRRGAKKTNAKSNQRIGM
jgi:hypothetical protein